MTVEKLISHVESKPAGYLTERISQIYTENLWELAARLASLDDVERKAEPSHSPRHQVNDPDSDAPRAQGGDHDREASRGASGDLRRDPNERLKARLKEASLLASELQIRVDELIAERTALTLEVERLTLSVERLEGELRGSRDEAEVLMFALDEYRALESERAPLDERCSDLDEAARLLEVVLDVTPHAPPLQDVFTVHALPSEERAHRREVSYREQRCTLRYVRRAEGERALSSLKRSWELEAQNMRELSEANTPSLARLMFAPPSRSPGYALWSRPQGILLSDLAGGGTLSAEEVCSMGLSLLQALELRADHRSVNFMPRLDAMSYERSRGIMTLLEPAAVSESALSPPEWRDLDQLYLLTRSELERGWVFGVCELIKMLIIPAEVSATLTESSAPRALKVSITKAARRSQRDHSVADLESLHITLLSGLSADPNKRPPIKRLRATLSEGT